MARRKPTEAFDIPESALRGQWTTYADVGRWLATEIDHGKEARNSREPQVKYAWALYEQQRTRSRMPWPDAADLTSPMASEYLDSLHARLMTTIFTEPVWTVEGWGPSAIKAPFVEEFHQRAQEEERLQGYADVMVMRALAEGVGTLEVSEAFEMRREVRRAKVAPQRDAIGHIVMGPDGTTPELQRDGESFVEVDDPNQPSVEIELEEAVPVRVGPAYDVIPYLDFLTLPAHARHRDQIWGYAKRFWRRVPELQARAKAGVYDAKAVEAIGTQNERTHEASEAPQQLAVPIQEGTTAQKELYEVQFLADLDGKGERWWRGTIHHDTATLVRLKFDDRTTRYLRYIPFPKPHTIDHGYSLIVDKMITVIEEDTAVRNMRADRAALKASQPIKRLQNALWDPYEQPFKPGGVIDVRDMQELGEFKIDDVPASILQWKSDVRADAERLVGQNEIAQGQQTEERRTLGEVQLQASYAEVRMNVLIRRFQEMLEELFQVRHLIWQRTIAGGTLTAARSRAMVIGTPADGVQVQGLGSDGTISAELLDGVFWGKPRGSVETADLNRQRADFNSFLGILPALAQMNPMIQQLFATGPAAKSLIKTAMKVNRVQDVQSIIGPEANGVFEQMQQAQDPRLQLLKALASAAPPMSGGSPEGGGMPPERPAESAGGVGVM